MEKGKGLYKKTEPTMPNFSGEELPQTTESAGESNLPAEDKFGEGWNNSERRAEAHRGLVTDNPNEEELSRSSGFSDPVRQARVQRELGLTDNPNVLRQLVQEGKLPQSALQPEQASILAKLVGYPWKLWGKITDQKDGKINSLKGFGKWTWRNKKPLVLAGGGIAGLVGTYFAADYLFSDQQATVDQDFVVDKNGRLVPTTTTQATETIARPTDAAATPTTNSTETTVQNSSQIIDNGLPANLFKLTNPADCPVDVEDRKDQGFWSLNLTNPNQGDYPLTRGVLVTQIENALRAQGLAEHVNVDEVLAANGLSSLDENRDPYAHVDFTIPTLSELSLCFPVYETD